MKRKEPKNSGISDGEPTSKQSKKLGRIRKKKKRVLTVHCFHEWSWDSPTMGTSRPREHPSKTSDTVDSVGPGLSEDEEPPTLVEMDTPTVVTVRDTGPENAASNEEVPAVDVNTRSSRVEAPGPPVEIQMSDSVMTTDMSKVPPLRSCANHDTVENTLSDQHGTPDPLDRSDMTHDSAISLVLTEHVGDKCCRKSNRPCKQMKGKVKTLDRTKACTDGGRNSSGIVTSRPTIPHGAVKQEFLAWLRSVVSPVLLDRHFFANKKPLPFRKKESRQKVSIRERRHVFVAEEVDTRISYLDAHTKSFFLEDGKTVVLLLKHSGKLTFKGRIKLRVVRGAVSIFGSRIATGSDYHRIYSPLSVGFLTVEALPFEEHPRPYTDVIHSLLALGGCRRKLANNINSMAGMRYTILALQKLESTQCAYLDWISHAFFYAEPDCKVFPWDKLSWEYGFHVQKAFKAIAITPRWSEIAETIDRARRSGGEPPRVMICGGKKLGKSTLTRFLMNRTLDSCEEICYMELDPGQTEFTPPGLLSLLKLTEPCLGPSYIDHRDPQLMLFVGGASVAGEPHRHTRCAQKLMDFYRTSVHLSKLPLFVNTMGWTKGAGPILLAEAIRIVRPTYIIQIQGVKLAIRNPPLLTDEYLRGCYSWDVDFVSKERFQHELIVLESAVTLDESKFTSANIRNINLLAYFSRVQPSEQHWLPISKCPVFKVPWSAVAIHVATNPVMNSDVLLAINASFVALCRCSPEDMMQSEDPTLPKFLNKFPVCECYGYGIVRGIDTTAKIIYVTTPVTPDRLAGVNSLIKGSMPVPPDIAMFQSARTPTVPYTYFRTAVMHRELALQTLTAEHPNRGTRTRHMNSSDRRLRQ